MSCPVDIVCWQQKVCVSGSSAAITGAFQEPEVEQQLEFLFGAGTTEPQLSLKRGEIEAFVHQVSSSGFWREVLYIGPSTNGSARLQGSMDMRPNVDPQWIRFHGLRMTMM